MHMLYRTIVHLLIDLRAPRIGLTDVCTTFFRVAPTDLDIMNHVNNGKYLGLMDIARQSLIVRAGLLGLFKREGWSPVVAASTIAYRKSLQPWMKFGIETRFIGVDDQAIYLEQRFVRPDANGELEVYARGFIRGRFVKRGGGVVRIDDLLEKLGIERSDFEMSEEMLDWAELTRLPSTRAQAPSDWTNVTDSHSFDQ